MKLTKRLLSAAAALTVFAAPLPELLSTGVTAYASMSLSEFPAGYSHPTEMRGLTAFQLVSDMGAGWNLGNSLESENNETYWGNPVTTKAMIDKIAAAGFTTLRVPVRWDDHYTNGYNISSDYFDRVETVVNYGLANGMYVILNCHHNDLQTKASEDASVQAQVKQELDSIWTQIAERFKNYGDKLIFETINEPRNGEDWTGNSALYKCVSDYNETARAAIRRTGGNNAKRLIMMPTYCASGDSAKISGWSSGGDDMVAASIHAYLPFDFAFNGDGHTQWNTSDLSELKSFFIRIYSGFISQGVPVVIGEFGACNKENTDQRELYAKIYPALARQFAEQDIPCVWWDNNAFNKGAENFGIFNRNSGSFTYAGIAKNLNEAFTGDPQYETEASGENVVFSGNASSSGWGQAVSMDASVVTAMKTGDKLVCSYSSDSSPELIFQSFTDSSKGWVKVSPDSISGGTAEWSVSSLLNAFGGSFDALGKVYIGDTGSSLTVTKVSVANASGGHVHVYNGQQTVTLQPSADTNGRKTVKCSVDGCDQIKVTVIPATGNDKTSVSGLDAKYDTSVVLSWDKLTAASKYRIRRNDGSGWTTLSTVSGTSFTDSAVVSGTKYEYIVIPYINGSFDTSRQSETISVQIPAEDKRPVLTVTAQENNVTVTWSKVSGATKYRIRRNDGIGWTTLQTSTKTSYTDAAAEKGKRYTYVVYPYINGSFGEPSETVKVALVGGSGSAALTAVRDDGKAVISWAQIPGVKKYRVRRNDGTAWKTMASTANLSWTDNTVVSGTAYTYVVYISTDGVTYSAPSSTLTLKG